MKSMPAVFILSSLLSLIAAVSGCGGRTPEVRAHAINTNRLEIVKGLFNLDDLPVITIEISSNEWNKLLFLIDSNSRTETMVSADFSLLKDGKTTVVTNSGFRIRGNTFSRVRPEGKKKLAHDPLKPDYHQAHFRLDFTDNYPNGGLNGLKALNLKFANGDPTYVHEIYSFDLFRRFGVWTAVYNSYARLYIKIKEDPRPACFGVYEMLESIDANFIKTRFGGDSDGYLWKCLWGADFKISQLNMKTGIESINPTNDKLSKRYPYDLKTRRGDFTNARASLNRFVSNLNTLKGAEFESWVEKAMDVDLMLRAQAVNTLLGMWDDYWVNQNNYYVYIDQGDRLYFIPYDYDNTLGTTTIVENAGTQNVFNWGDMKGSRPLVSKLLSVQRFREKYSNYIAELIDPANGYFSMGAGTNRIVRWQNLIRPYVSNDTGDNLAIEDRPAKWGATSFYRLLSGDKYGGPLPANYFLSRCYFAGIQLGLWKQDPEADITIRMEGLTKHPGGYYFTFSATNRLTVILTGEKTAVLEMLGMINTNITNPAPTNAFLVTLPDMRVSNVLSRGNEGIQVRNAKGDLKRSVFQLLLFRNDYSSPEFKDGTVTFRYPYKGTNRVEMAGFFNEWGRKKTYALTNLPSGISEITLATNEIPAGAGYVFFVNNEKMWGPDLANTNNEGRGNFFSIYQIQKP